jgi:excisionase family DNA binding protein
MDELIKLQDAANRLGISRSRLYTLASQGKVPCVRIGGQGRLMFRSVDIDEQLKPWTQTPGLVDLRAEADDAEPTLDLGITEAEMEVCLRAAFKALIEVRAEVNHG